MHIAASVGNVDLMKLLNKNGFNWNLLSHSSSSSSIFLMLCENKSVDCMKFYWQHCKQLIDITQVSEDKLELDCLNVAVHYGCFFFCNRWKRWNWWNWWKLWKLGWKLVVCGGHGGSLGEAILCIIL